MKSIQEYAMRIIFSSFFVMSVLAILLVPFSFGIDLKSYRWNSRLLLVFSPNNANRYYETFEEELSNRHREIEDRDLIVFRIFETQGSRLADRPLTPEDAEKLRRRFEVESDRFTVILIGKDGGLKMSRPGGVTPREVFDRIDSMPMRQREMRENK
jgi:hypothetical protein